MNSTNFKNFALFNDFKQSKRKFALFFIYFIILSPFVSSILTIIFTLCAGKPMVIGPSYMPIAYPLFWFGFLCIDLKSFFNKKDLTTIKETNFLKKYPEIFCLLFMVIWVFIATATHEYPSFTFYHETLYLQTGSYFFITLSLCFLCGVLITDRSILKHLAIAYLVSLIYCSFLSILFPQGDMLLLLAHNTNWASMFTNSNHFAYLLCMGISLSSCLLLFEKKKATKIFLCVAMTIFMFTLIMNDTLGSTLATLIALTAIPVVFSIWQKKFDWRFLIPLAVFVVFSVALTPLAKVYHSTYDESPLWPQLANLMKEFFSIAEAPLAEENMSAGTDRWSKWIASYNEICAHPIFGNGIVTSKPHNEYLQLAENFGLPTLFLYLSAIVIITIKVLRHFKKMSALSLSLYVTVVTYLISATFGNFMIHTSHFYVSILAIAISSINVDIDKSKLSFESKTLPKDSTDNSSGEAHPSNQTPNKHKVKESQI